MFPIINVKYLCLVPFLTNAWFTSKRIADANLSLAYLNGLTWILETRPTGWILEKKIVSVLTTFAYLYTIDIFSDSSCLTLEQQRYIHALSRVSILIVFGVILVNQHIVKYIMPFTYTTFTLYLLLTRPCEVYYVSLGSLGLFMTSILYLAKSPGQHIGFATYLYCISKSLRM